MKQGDNAIGSIRPSVRFCLALPSAARSNESHYQSIKCLSVSVIRGRIWIITRMQSISFYFCAQLALRMDKVWGKGIQGGYNQFITEKLRGETKRATRDRVAVVPIFY